MDRLVYNNGKGNLTFASELASFGTSTIEYQIHSISGLSESEIILPSVRGYQQNGQSLQGYNLGTRIVTIEFYAYARNSQTIAAYRKKLCSMCNPMNGEGTLTYFNSITNKTYVLTKCICSQMPKVQKVYANNLYLMSIEFTAYNPLWRSNEARTYKNYFTAGDLTVYQHFNPANGGDVPSPYKMVVNGPVYKGYIRLIDTSSGGQAIQNNFTFNAGAYQSTSTRMEQTTEYGNKNLYIKSGNNLVLANKYITDPDFFDIPVGTNSYMPLYYGFQLGSQATAANYCEITYYDWFVGV